MSSETGSKEYAHAPIMKDIKELEKQMILFHEKYNISESFTENSAIYILIKGHGCIYNSPDREHFILQPMLQQNVYYNSLIPISSCPSFHLSELDDYFSCLKSKIGRDYNETEFKQKTIHDIYECNEDYLNLYKENIKYANLLDDVVDKEGYKRALNVLHESTVKFKKPYSDKRLFIDEPEMGIHILQVQTKDKKDYFNILRNPLFSANNSQHIKSLKLFGEDFMEARKNIGKPRSLLLSELIYILRIILKFNKVYIFDHTCNGSCFGKPENPEYWELNKEMSPYVQSLTKTKSKSRSKKNGSIGSTLSTEYTDDSVLNGIMNEINEDMTNSYTSSASTTRKSSKSTRSSRSSRSSKSSKSARSSKSSRSSKTKKSKSK